MGARTYFAAALAVLLLARVASAEPLAQAPKPGALETYRDWTVGCDNRNRCEAVSLLPEGGEWSDAPVMLGISRTAEADAGAEVRISRNGGGRADLALFIDGRKIASASARNGDATIAGPQAAAVAIAMARGGVMEIRAGQKLIGRPSLAGSAAALRYMDARQGRAGTITALIATGALGATAVRPAPAPFIVKRAVIPATPLPAVLWREELTALGKFTGCTDEMKDAQPPAQYRLSRAETLILVPCGAGAYNFTSVPVIATGIAGRRSWRFAAFDYQPGWSEDPQHPMLVNAGFTPDRSRLESFAKGRGIGDCGGSEAYVWDGARFRLVEASAMGECRGAWRWITTWSAQVIE